MHHLHIRFTDGLAAGLISLQYHTSQHSINYMENPLTNMWTEVRAFRAFPGLSEPGFRLPKNNIFIFI
jgi:hypothetical protein